MNKFTNFICKHKTLILIIALLLLIPSLIGIKETKINYDILVYLPKDIETIKGQNILTDDFNMGAFSISIIDNMEAKDVIKLENKIKKVKGVNEVASLYDVIGTNIPIEILPDEVTDRLAKKDSSLLLITFKDGTSEETTLNAVREIRKLTKENVKVAGMSAMVLDTMDLSNKEILSYVIIAVILCLIVLMLSLDSYLVPFILLLNIGIAILFNMGTNVFLGNISYITKAISAVLQLGVTTDFSIFLYHKYENCKKKAKNKEEAMKEAIKDTITAVTGSSLTTIAGFLALCFMTLTLGKDIGIVMAKGVLLGVICVITLFPALLLIFDKQIEKTSHKVILPTFKKLKDFTIKHYKAIFIVFLLLTIPAIIGQRKTEVYYNLDRTLPSYLSSSVANKSLKEDYNIVSPEMILIDKNISNDDINDMIDEIKKIDGIDFAISNSSLSDLGLPIDMLDNNLSSMVESDKYKMVILNSKYDIATKKLNEQISKVNKIVKKYDSKAIVAGEGPLMKDLVEISDTDFKNVNYVSILVILVIMLFVLKSYSLPILLICVIEFAIFLNMSVPYYTHTSIPFIASIVIGTIQLGATIDYAILMTTKYLEERKTKDKIKAIKASLDNSVSSIFVSGMCFFAATFGVGVYSKLEMIGSLCSLISRGAIISMITVIMVLPSVLIIFDKLICKTTKGFKKGDVNMKNKKALNKVMQALLIGMLIIPQSVFALTKDETVYAKFKNNGKVKNVTVTEHLINDDKLTNINDLTNLNNIKNLNGNEKYTLDNNKLTWQSKSKKDIYYQGSSNNNLPITLDITYKLNGKIKKANEMKNKKGDVEITIKLINNDKHYVNGKNLYTPFVSALTTIVPTKYNSNVTVSNGKVISTGTNNVIAAIASPGLYESLGMEELKNLDTVTIKYTTEKFNLNSIYIASTPKILDSSDLDKLDNLDGIYSKVNSLSDAAYKIAAGSNDLKDGLEKSSIGTKKINDGIKNVYSGSNILTNAVSKSISDLENDTSDALDSNTIDYIINTSVNSATLTEEQKNYIGNKAVNEIRENENYKVIKAKYDAGLSSVSSLGITDEIIKICVSGNAQGKYTQICNDEKLASLISAKQMMIIMEETAKQTAIKTSEEVTANVAKNVSKSVAINVSNNVKTAATKKTKEQLSLLKENLDKLNNGINELSNGMDELYNGSTKLLNGANELNNGINKFNNDGISKITNIINTDLKSKANILKDLKNLSKKYNSYTLKENNTKGSTKFIYLINGTKK